MRLALTTTVWPALGFIMLGVIPATATQQGCKAVERLNGGENIEQLADRCGISVDALLRANDASSPDRLEEREVIAVPQDRLGKDWLERARGAVVDAGRQVTEAATAAGRSVSDYLKDQPDLNQEVLSFGERLGLPGVASGPTTGPRLEVVVQDEEKLEVSASGLPGNTDVIFGWLSDGVVEPLEKLATDSQGHLDATAQRPTALAHDNRVMFVVETADKRLRLAADPVSGR
ncbi:LysM peptidoglycan-binding domain-containing protein [Rhizobium halophytocola]|uniref:LysM domain-containing protein n=1 Tax=Rhizobium halophytocola TaxID=735519 RepID=A0ABS4E4M9_9HYPH|nr:LysM peptidoglycan-binding domain-containing protein [Rhizobium halophytocola]MBP1852895.1 hypothetical protein [Rhizobium halophytocola]